jgi:hypothetical protein
MVFSFIADRQTHIRADINFCRTGYFISNLKLSWLISCGRGWKTNFHQLNQTQTVRGVVKILLFFIPINNRGMICKLVLVPSAFWFVVNVLLTEIRSLTETPKISQFQSDLIFAR